MEPIKILIDVELGTAGQARGAWNYQSHAWGHGTVTPLVALRHSGIASSVLFTQSTACGILATADLKRASILKGGGSHRVDHNVHLALCLGSWGDYFAKSDHG
jgi:hypothetical protein